MPIRFYPLLSFVIFITFPSFNFASNNSGGDLFMHLHDKHNIYYEKLTSTSPLGSIISPSDTTLHSQEPNILNENQYLSMIANLNLSGVWYSTNNETQQGDFFTRDYGFIIFEGELVTDYNSHLTSNHTVKLKIYDGYNVDYKSLSVNFTCEDLEFNSQNVSFYGSVYANEFKGYFGVIGDGSDHENNTADATPCWIFVQLSFINTTTNFPLFQVPDYDFSNAGVQATIYSPECSIFAMSNTLLNEPLPTTYLTIYSWIMSIILGGGAISGIFILCSFPRNASKLKTTGIIGLYFSLVWQIFIILLSFINNENALGAPVLISFINCFVLILMMRHVFLVTYRDRAHRRVVEDKWWFMVSMACISLIYLTSNFFPVCTWLLLISCLSLVPQLREKHRREHRAGVYWLFNTVFIAPQMLFTSYLFFYENNIFNYQVNIPLGAIYIFAFCSQFAVLALWKRRPSGRVSQGQQVFLASEVQNFSAEYQNESPLLPPNQKSPGRKISSVQKHFEYDVCTICTEGFVTPPVEIKKCPVDDDVNAAGIVPCGHAFHRVCLKEWFKRKKLCPLCKKDLSHITLN